MVVWDGVGWRGMAWMVWDGVVWRVIVWDGVVRSNHINTPTHKDKVRL